MTTAVPHTNGHDHSAIPTFDGGPIADAVDGVRTYRGRSVEELIPQIRAELGSDAVILRQREGLVGGVGGFFAQRCVEVDVRAGGPGVDVYDDEEDEAMPSFAGQLEAEVASAETMSVETAAITDVAPVEEPAAPVEPKPAPAKRRTSRRNRNTSISEQPAAPVAPKPARAVKAPAPAAKPRDLDAEARAQVVDRLCELGASETWAAALLTQGAVHSSPFAAEGNLIGAVLDTLTRTLPQAAPLPLGGGAIAFVGGGGSGKTSCVAGLAAAYRRASTMPVTAIAIGSRDGGRTLAELLEPIGVPVAAFATAREVAARVAEARVTGLVIIDTAAPRPGDVDGIDAFAADLEELALDAVHLTLPATLGARTAQRLLDAMAPTGYTGIALTHVDETDQLGTALELSCTKQLPIAYLHEGVEIASALSAPHPAQLAARVL